MPLLAMNLSDTLYDQVKVLVEKGLYKSFESFLEIAAFNQLAMERGATPAEIVERGHRKVKDHRDGNGMARSEKAEPIAKAIRSAPVRAAVEPVARLAPDEARLKDEDYELAFKRLALAENPNHPEPIAAKPDELSQDRLFGQVNRLFPLKLACRWLANSAVTEGRWPRYEIISDKLADDAATLGSLLERWDVETERKRDEMLSTGLPRRGNSASRDRFLGQFLARVTRSSEIFPAAICQYELARFDDSTLALTAQGLAFSSLVNPILDKRDKNVAATLAAEETAFLVRQILEWVPAEREDMRAALIAIGAGSKTPTELTEAIRERFPPDWSDSVIQTHASGIVARLGELRLLKRIWQGRNVTYELGDELQVDTLLRFETKERS
jgi:hypothetical protein